MLRSRARTRSSGPAVVGRRRGGSGGARPVVPAALVALALATGAAAQPAGDRLRDARTWAFAIGTGSLEKVVRRPAAFDLVVVDGEEVRPRHVRRLHRRGAVVLGYLSVGTIERYRWWYRHARPYRLELWGDWGEWYAATSRRGFRNLVVRRVAPPMLAKGLDGLFLDNTDMIETHPGQRTGMRRLVARLSRLVHRRDKLLFTQNGESSIGRTIRHYDGWNREDVTWTYDFDRERYVRVGRADRIAAVRALRRMRARGLVVTTTDYLPPGRRNALEEAITRACRARALPYVSDIELRRVPRALRC